MKTLLIIIVLTICIKCITPTSSIYEHELIETWETRMPPCYVVFKIMHGGSFEISGVNYFEKGHWFTDKDTLYREYNNSNKIIGTLYYIIKDTLFLNHPPLERLYKKQ